MATAGDQYDFRTGNIWNFANRDDIQQVKRLVGSATRRGAAGRSAGDPMKTNGDELLVGNYEEGDARRGAGVRSGRSSEEKKSSVGKSQASDDGAPPVGEDTNTSFQNYTEFGLGPESLSPQLTTAVEARREQDSASCYFSSEVSPELRNKVGWTPLHAAAHGGALRVLSWLLYTCRVERNPQCNAGRTPLMDAARTGNFHAVKLLLKAKADALAEDNQQRTALHYAAKDRATRDLLAAKMTQKNTGPISESQNVFLPGTGDDVVRKNAHARAGGQIDNSPAAGRKAQRKKKFGRNVVSSEDDEQGKATGKIVK
ncbi:unnamed protein product [Amoebophrya sp. A120]|nr:unnamed protein product [Amoebophrya sp. A120]|eukprot:GSA120T00002627001.1